MVAQASRVKSSLEKVYELCNLVEATGGIKEKLDIEGEEFFVTALKTHLLYFLAYLSASDGVLSWKECRYISDLLDINIKQMDENGDPVYKDICNPITKDFRDQLYGAILSSFQNDREATIGEADGRNIPNYGIKVTPINNGGTTVGIARIYLEDAFVISNVAIKQTKDGKTFASMIPFHFDFL